MIDEKKNQKEFRTIVYETYKDFAENTSIHGLKYTVKTGIVIYEKIFWIIVVLAGLLGAAYMTVLFWNRYTSNPTRTSILTAFAPTTSLPFPAVTICNINRIMDSKVKDFLKRLVIPADQVEIVGKAFPQLLAFTNPASTNYNATDLAALHSVLLANDYSDINVVMKKITQSCAEMLIKCRWSLKGVPCGELFEESFSSDGSCCSFNYDTSFLKLAKYREQQSNILYSPFSGFSNGLIVLLNPMIEAVQYSALHSSGFKVIIHSPEDYPGSGAIYKIVAAGSQAYLQVSGSKIVCSADVRELSIEQRQCAYSGELSLKYYSQYADTNCLTECEEQNFFLKCGCVPYYYPFSDRPICNSTMIPCLDESKGEPSLLQSCNCPSQCEDEFYQVLSTTAKLDYHESFTTSSFLRDENVNDTNTVLYVYFANQRQTILFKDTITSTIYLLSSFGGVYSLFLGCSFITIVEILYYCSFRLIVNLKILGRIDRIPASKTQTENKFRTDYPNKHIKLWNTDYERNIFLN